MYLVSGILLETLTDILSSIKHNMKEDWKNQLFKHKKILPHRLIGFSQQRGILKQQAGAGAELGQAQLKLELELSFTCCIKLINKNTAGYFDCH